MSLKAGYIFNLVIHEKEFLHIHMIVYFLTNKNEVHLIP